MLSEEKTELLKNVISIMDSFQQDYGILRYSINVSSYTGFHQILVNIFNTVDTIKLKLYVIDISLRIVVDDE